MGFFLKEKSVSPAAQSPRGSGLGWVALDTPQAPERVRDLGGWGAWSPHCLLLAWTSGAGLGVSSEALLDLRRDAVGCGLLAVWASLASCVLWQGWCEWLPDIGSPHADQTLVLGLRLWRAGDPARAVLEEGFPSLGTCRSLEASRPRRLQGLGCGGGWSIQEGVAGVCSPSWDLCFHSVPLFCASVCLHVPGTWVWVAGTCLCCPRFRELASSGLHAHLFSGLTNGFGAARGREAGAGRRPGERRPRRARAAHPESSISSSSSQLCGMGQALGVPAPAARSVRLTVGTTACELSTTLRRQVTSTGLPPAWFITEAAGRSWGSCGWDLPLSCLAQAGPRLGN